jgi:hypothetical protein
MCYSSTFTEEARLSFRPLENSPASEQVFELSQAPYSPEELIPRDTLTKELETWTTLLNGLAERPETIMRAGSARVASGIILHHLYGLAETREAAARHFNESDSPNIADIWQLQAHYTLAISRLVFESCPDKLDPYRVQLDFDVASYLEGGLHVPADIAKSIGVDLGETPREGSHWFESDTIYVEATHPAKYSPSLQHGMQLGGMTVDPPVEHARLYPYLRRDTYQQTFFPDEV